VKSADVAQPAKQPSAAQRSRNVWRPATLRHRSAISKGDARQTYMSFCLSGKMSQSTLMKICNAEATQEKLTSDDRKAYLATCLKKSA
jgi:psiF repeat